MKRLKAIADKVPIASNVADIGTDHGFIPVYLIKNHIASRVIATDISPESLDKAKRLIEAEGLTDYIEARVGPGLKTIKAGEVDTVIIAGMGGILIKNILEESPDVLKDIKTLILQPMNLQNELRHWLIENMFTIKDEELVMDNERIYEIMVVVHGQQEQWNEIELEISPRLLSKRDELLKPFVLEKIKRVESIIDILKNQETQNAIKRRKECEKKLEQYKEVYQWIVQWER